MYEPSLSICLSSLVLWKLISSRSCSSMVGGLARPDDELLARVAMPSGCSRGSRGAIPPRVPAVCRHDHNRQRIHAHRACVCVVRRDARVSSNHGWPRDAYEPYETIEVIVNRLLRSASRRFSFLYPRFSPIGRRGCHRRHAFISPAREERALHVEEKARVDSLVALRHTRSTFTLFLRTDEQRTGNPMTRDSRDSLTQWLDNLAHARRDYASLAPAARSFRICSFLQHRVRRRDIPYLGDSRVSIGRRSDF